MPATASTAPSVTDPRCGVCSYSLAGLDQSDRCPECGAACFPGQIVLFGRRDRFSNMDGMPFDAVAWGFGALIYLLPMFYPAARQYRAVWGIVIASIFLVWVVYRLLIVILPFINGVSGPVQLLLSPAGFGTRRGFGEVRLTAWRHRTKLSILRGWGGTWTLYLDTEPPFARGHQSSAHGVRFRIKASPQEIQRIRDAVYAWKLDAVS